MSDVVQVPRRVLVGLLEAAEGYGILGMQEYRDLCPGVDEAERADLEARIVSIERSLHVADILLGPPASG